METKKQQNNISVFRENYHEPRNSKLPCKNNNKDIFRQTKPQRPYHQETHTEEISKGYTSEKNITELKKGDASRSGTQHNWLTCTYN